MTPRNGLTRIAFAALAALFKTLAQGSINVADAFTWLAGWVGQRTLPKNLPSANQSPTFVAS